MHTIYWKLSDMDTYTYTHIGILVTGQLLISAHTHTQTHTHTYTHIQTHMQTHVYEDG